MVLSCVEPTLQCVFLSGAYTMVKRVTIFPPSLTSRPSFQRKEIMLAINGDPLFD
jgi:hypothetical protein